MRDALPGLGLRGRIGVNTGEVVTGTAERLVTGDAVNVAARFEQAAAPGEVLIGEATHALVNERGGRGAGRGARAEGEVGAGAGVPARLAAGGAGAQPCVEVRRDVSASSTLIGEAWERAQARATLRAGDGGGRGGGRQVAARGGGAGHDRGAGRARALPALRGGDHLLAGGGGAEAARCVCRRIRPRPRRSARCSAESTRGRAADEIAWAFRKLLEEQAPLVVCLRRHAVGRGDVPRPDRVTSRSLSTGAPLLLLCMARPELVEQPPDLAGHAAARTVADAEHGRALIGDGRRRRSCGERIAPGRRRQPAVHPRDAGDGGRPGGRSRCRPDA